MQEAARHQYAKLVRQLEEARVLSGRLSSEPSGTDDHADGRRAWQTLAAAIAPLLACMTADGQTILGETYKGQENDVLAHLKVLLELFKILHAVKPTMPTELLNNHEDFVSEIFSLNDLFFDVIIKRYARPIHAYARARGIPNEERDDFVQDALTRILGRLSRYDPNRAGPSGGAAWIWRLVSSELADWHRRHGREVPQDPFGVAADGDTVSDDEASARASRAYGGIDPERLRRTHAFRAAWARLAKAERDALERGRGTGHGHANYWPAKARFEQLYREYYQAVSAIDRAIVDDS